MRHCIHRSTFLSVETFSKVWIVDAVIKKYFLECITIVQSK